MAQTEFVTQEWYCTKSGGGCGGYITVNLNMAINGVVEMICPKCGHKHQRCIDNGVVKEQGRHTGKPTEEICPTIADYSKEPRSRRHARLKKVLNGKKRRQYGKGANERDGAVISSNKDIASQGFVDDLWDNKASNE